MSHLPPQPHLSKVLPKAINPTNPQKNNNAILIQQQQSSNNPKTATSTNNPNNNLNQQPQQQPEPGKPNYFCPPSLIPSQALLLPPSPVDVTLGWRNPAPGAAQINVTMATTRFQNIVSWESKVPPPKATPPKK